MEPELTRVGTSLQLVRKLQFRGSPNEGAAKAVNIQAHIGARPIVAGGNTAVDTEMLDSTHTDRHAALCLVIDHDDDEREPVGQTAARLGCTVVSMANDWGRVFPTG